MTHTWRGLLVLLLNFAGQAAAAPASIPPRLSSWNMLQVDEASEADSPQLKLAPSVLLYDLNTALFSDHALKLRLIRLPPATQMGYSSEEVLDFPVGTVIAKTFAYPVADLQTIPTAIGMRVTASELFPQVDGDILLIETRILVRQEKGWLALPYVWQADLKDATLALTGRSQALSLDLGDGFTNFNYEVPNANQCKSCHVRVDGFDKRITPIGPRARFLNRPNHLLGADSNQLTHWAELGLLAGLPELTEVPRAPAAFDPDSGTLEQRARAYLDINCAHCHRPNGLASSTGLFLTSTNTDPMRMGICKSPIAAGNGSNQDGFDIEPGHPERSLLLLRLRSTDPAMRMPEVGRNLADPRGVALVEAWISQLSGACR